MRDRTTKKMPVHLCALWDFKNIKTNNATHVHMLQNQGFSNRQKQLEIIFPVKYGI